jgi:hypothetical protein
MRIENLIVKNISHLGIAPAEAGGFNTRRLTHHSDQPFGCALNLNSICKIHVVDNTNFGTLKAMDILNGNNWTHIGFG